MPRYDGNYKTAWVRAEENQYHTSDFKKDLTKKSSILRNLFVSNGVTDHNREPMDIKEALALIKNPKSKIPEINSFWGWAIGALSKRRKSRDGKPIYIPKSIELGLRACQKNNLWALHAVFPNRIRGDKKVRAFFAKKERQEVHKKIKDAEADHVKGVVKVYRRRDQTTKLPDKAPEPRKVNLPPPMWTDED